MEGLIIFYILFPHVTTTFGMRLVIYKTLFKFSIISTHVLYLFCFVVVFLGTLGFLTLSVFVRLLEAQVSIGQKLIF
jgi:hypothetical protein